MIEIRFLVGILYLYLIWFTGEVYRGKKNQKTIVNQINNQQSAIAKLSAQLNDMEFAVKNAKTKVFEYCEDRGGDPFLTSSENYIIVNCKNDNSLKFFINLIK